MSDAFTAAEIARQLGTPESTVRYHARRFAAYVPTVGEGRSRRYRLEALDALRFIGEQLHAGTPTTEVESALAARFPVTIEPQQQPVATQQQLSSSLAELFTGLQTEVAALRSEHAERHAELLRVLAERFDAQERELAGLRSLVEALRPAARRPWWRRVFGGS